MAKRRANGEGNIRKRKDGRWEGRYTAAYDPITGKRITTWYEVYAEPRLRPNTKLYYQNYINNHIIPGIGSINQLSFGFGKIHPSIAKQTTQ